MPKTKEDKKGSDKVQYYFINNKLVARPTQEGLDCLLHLQG